ncbi:hypothetical protein CHGG_10328 [Chaetomium globosum CBS 148.51]|uniref:Genetic interactor of prohibitins 3, mitochondrial n=1 Tax=Chaetomium globosum (strain ATCC 6205 / CBS 148.51 / DSM 1962 / NBRC 6347 / NRRL 1970) TaxID=306901 RepID=Q2GNX6_CHAGB|nr:uncharacterized protein CHGG_10328 [Chaetomium globosum CBS 148.51]EAQ83924.1 hypothetical protein CHGG_10328 [Chaetomium globosum CBS 148.51]
MAPGRALHSRWLGRVFNIERRATPSEVPLYLCPAFRSLSTEHATLRRSYRAKTSPVRVRRLHTETVASVNVEPLALNNQPTKTLPLQCHGCGALSQTTVPDEAGYYDVSRKAVKRYLGLMQETDEEKPQETDQIVQQALQSVDVEALERQGINLKALLPEREPVVKAAPAVEKPPLCDRCHTLIHHASGNSIYHPSIESLRDTIDESPYKHNHVYHVLDAADFPMSLLSKLHGLLDVTLRTQNRRSKSVKYQHGRRIEMSFIISRSDLLAPQKAQVDSLMPYLKETLREALGRVGGRVRLGNVHCVSAKRGWWTKDLKEEIWKRGGTTASPIRVPFGSGRGELIDLPGLARSDLEYHITPSQRSSLIMKARVLPEQQVLKPGQSLLLGGFLRLTPRNTAAAGDDELVFLAYAFTPLDAHTTATDKAVAVQTQAPDAPHVENIALPGTGAKIRHAGAFQLRYDVTKARTGPLTRKEAVGLKVDQLPYRVLGLDILVEGCGWVEVVVQVRTRQLFPSGGDGGWGDGNMQTLDLRPEPVNVEKRRSREEEERGVEARWPVIDVYSPEGAFIGYRSPMNAWMLNKPKRDTRARPRKSMKGAKKREKRERRAREAADV